MGNQPQKGNLRGVSKQNVSLFLVNCNIVLVLICFIRNNPSV